MISERILTCFITKIKYFYVKFSKKCCFFLKKIYHICIIFIIVSLKFLCFMEYYLMLFFRELRALDFECFLLLALSGMFTFFAGFLFKECFSLLNNKYFNLRHAIWLPIVLLLLSLLCSGPILFSPMADARVVMIILLIIFMAIGWLYCCNTHKKMD